MRKRIAAAATVVVLAACGRTAAPYVDLEGAFVPGLVEVTLPYGEQIQIAGTVLDLILTDVPEDSRCPTDVTCVWAGNAVVEVGIRAGMGPTFLLRLNTTLEPRSAEWNDIRVTLLDLTPLPMSGGTIIPTDYSARIRLEPVS